MSQQPFWPGGARLAVSLSLMFEGGGQPISGAGGPIPEPIKDGLPDLPTNAFFAYGPNEGIPRILDLMDNTFHMNDISSFPFEGYNPIAYEQALKDEFDQLYEEGATRRRMMVFSMHDRISGHAARVRVLDRFLTYARSKPGVWFARKDEIARYALETRGMTPIIDRGPPTETGLPGPAAV